jgi:hypothetical protein
MTFPDLLTVTVTIGGVDVTAKIKPGSLSIQNILTQQMDTYSASLIESLSLNLESWQEVIALNGAERIFGGYLLTTEDELGINLNTDAKVDASDYSVRFEKVIVKEEYSNMTDKAMIAAFFAKYLPGEGFDVSTYVEEIKTHTRLRFNRCTLFDAIKQLANLANADWYVDYDKKLHFFETGTSGTPAPFGLSSSPDMSTTYPFYDLQVNKDGSGVVNRVEVVGGNYYSEDATFYLAGTGQDTRVSLPFKMHAPDGETAIQVYRNDGTQASPVWTALTVLTGYIDDLTATGQVLHYFQEKVLEQQNAWPDLPNAVKVVAKYEVPLRTRLQDTESYEYYGMYMDDVIIDTTITDKAVARLAGMTKLAQNSMEKTAISLKVDQPGLRAGHIVTLVDSLRGINDSFVIQKVSTKIDVNGRAYYSVSMGTYNPGLIDFMLRLAKSSKQKISWSDEEVLDEVLQIVEGIELSETTSVTATSGPYYFSETPANAFIWGFGTFTP